MAKKPTSARPSFYEVVFRGKPKVVRAFLSGLIVGSELEATIYYNYDVGIEHGGTAEKLADLVGIGGAACHAIVDAGTAALLRKLRKRINTETALEITALRRVKSARMEFEFHTYGPTYHRQIVDLLRGLPAGLKLKDYWTEVQEDPEAKGVEAYTVAHEFSSSGKGAVVGRVDLLVAFKDECAAYPLMETEDIKLTVS